VAVGGAAIHAARRLANSLVARHDLFVFAPVPDTLPGTLLVRRFARVFQETGVIVHRCMVSHALYLSLDHAILFIIYI